MQQALSWPAFKTLQAEVVHTHILIVWGEGDVKVVLF